MPNIDKEQCHTYAGDERERRKAAAWAWYEHAGGAVGRGKSEAAAIVHARARRPSRFKVEAEAKARKVPSKRHSFDSVYIWSPACEPKAFESLNERLDCGSSLFDSFELVSMSKQMDTRLTAPAMKPARKSSAAPVVAANLRPDADPTHARGHHHKNPKFHMPVPRPLCRSVEIVSSLREFDRPAAESYSPKYARLKSNRLQKNQGQANGEFEQEYHEHKGGTSHRLSFQGISKAFNHLVHRHHGDHKQHEQQQHHHHGPQHKHIHHHHHHHHYLFTSEEAFKPADLDKAMMKAGGSVPIHKISPFLSHLEPLPK